MPLAHESALPLSEHASTAIDKGVLSLAASDIPCSLPARWGAGNLPRQTCTKLAFIASGEHTRQRGVRATMSARRIHVEIAQAILGGHCWPARRRRRSA